MAFGQHRKPRQVKIPKLQVQGLPSDLAETGLMARTLLQQRQGRGSILRPQDVARRRKPSTTQPKPPKPRPAQIQPAWPRKIRVPKGSRRPPRAIRIPKGSKKQDR